jgi:flagellar M-ring protein FliF
MAMNQDQFEYTRNLERNYIDRIEDILAPIVGIGGVRAQVSTLIDFTVTEQTSEAYNPDLPALRSEKVMEESSSSGGAAEGVPGALSNQPPANATAPETLFDANGQPVAASGPQNSRRSSTTNYELDRTISHTRMGGGNIKRLSIAVVVDDRTSINDQGEQVRESRSQGEMERITALVKEAVGYSAQRGDTLNVINAPFTQPEAIEAIPVEPIWEQAWAIDLAKTLGAVILGALLIFMVLRPMISNLAAVKPTASEMLPAGGGGGLAEDRLSIGGEPEGLIKLPSHGAYEDNIEMVKQVVNEDPKLVAQVVRNWIAEDK